MARRVDNSTIPPFNAIGLVLSTYDTVRTMGTASLIGPQFLLSCAHNFMGDGRGPLYYGRYYPAYNARDEERNAPDPSLGVRIRYVFVPSAYVNVPTPPRFWDIAICYLEQTVTVPVYFTPTNVSSLQGFSRDGDVVEVTTTGYPGSKYAEMWTSDDDIAYLDPSINLLVSTYDNEGGMSGAPVYNINTRAGSVNQFAVHIQGASVDIQGPTAGQELDCVAVAITDPVLTWMNSVMDFLNGRAAFPAHTIAINPQEFRTTQARTARRSADSPRANPPFSLPGIVGTSPSLPVVGSGATCEAPIQSSSPIHVSSPATIRIVKGGKVVNTFVVSD